MVMVEDQPELGMRCIDDVAADSVGFWMSDERADESRDGFFVHVDYIVVNLDKYCLGIEILKVSPEFRPRSFEIVDLDIGRGGID